ncbi:putative ABC transporter permease subunit [Vallitalea guaymasensis]|uniref:ABC-2 type transport system permease protein n=1 Tax=Vallitalea guaymasensis TaxID=1185412 RepID=A0A8J8M961_9FIRM|nr:hypothetical protein [Vallitalea guaymasensis]QUH28410.1 hypothetical protein HYG85_05535 [Vallitalea guaymasensis]
MRDIIRLTKVSLISGFNLHSFNIKNIRINKQLWKLLLAIAIIITFAVMYIGYFKFIDKLSLTFIQMNQSYYFNALLYNIMSLLIFIFGIPYIMAYFYFSKETEMLLALPIKPKNILVSKFLLLMIYEYIIVFLAVTPAFIINGIHQNAGLVYYVISVILLLIIPMVPLALCSIILMLVARVTNFSSKRNLIRGIFLFLITFLAIGIQIYLQNNAVLIEQGEFYQNLLTNNETLINMLGNINPLAKCLGTSLVSTLTIRSIMNLLIFIIVNLMFFGLFVVVGDKVYLDGIIGGNEVRSKKKELTDKEFNREINKKSSPYLAIFKIDFITILKTPIYLFNCYGAAIIVPIIIILPLMFGGEISSISIDSILDLYYVNTDFANFIIAGALILTCLFNPTSATTFSREGKYFWISRMIPVKSRDQIIGRSISALLPQIFLVIVLIIGLNSVLDVQIGTYIIGCGLGLLSSVPIILLGMIVDIQRPLLNWSNPQRAVKQNMNVIVTMLLGSIIVLGLGGLTWLLLRLMVDSMIIFGIDLVIILLLTIILYKILKNKIQVRFVEINQ